MVTKSVSCHQNILNFVVNPDAFFFSECTSAQEDEAVVEDDIGKAMDGSRTDDEVVERYRSKFVCLLIARTYV